MGKSPKFWKKKRGFFLSSEPRKILGKGNDQKSKEFLAKEKGKEIQGKEKRIREIGHTPSTAGTFGANSGKNPERPRKRSQSFFLEFPSRVWLGSPKPYNSRQFPDLLVQSISRIIPPPQYGWKQGFFILAEVVP